MSTKNAKKSTSKPASGKANNSKTKPMKQETKTKTKVVDAALEGIIDTKIEKIIPAPGKGEVMIENKLKALYGLQQVDSKIDKIRIVRGELPMEVNDLEDEIVGLETRLGKFTDELNQLEDQIVKRKLAIKESKEAIKKYEAQQNKVKNNREFDSLTKEIEFQTLEIQLSDKKIKEYNAEIVHKNEMIDASKKTFSERKKDLKIKKEELDSIVAETEKEENYLLKHSKNASNIVDERLLSAYHRIRENARNGMAVVKIERDACGGCFNKIPPQRQLDIRQRKKIIVCEHCGRILVDAEINVN